jgi:hypothetical protein
MTLILPRKYALIPLLALATYMTMGEVLDIFGFHFSPLRMMVLFVWARLIVRWEVTDLKFNEIDAALLAWVFSNVACYNLRELSWEAMVNRLGFAYDVIGCYFLFRYYIKDEDDTLVLIKSIAYLTIPLAGFMTLEKATGINYFSYFGGVPEFTVEREGSLRCQGPFAHPIMAGTFGALAIPLNAGLWFADKDRVAAVAAVISGTIMVVTSASSGPVLSFAAGVISLFSWIMRKYMREVRWFLTCSVIILHFAMKAPVWYTIARFSDIMGGTGWHRSELINQAITNIDDWWLLGTSKTSHWMPYKLRIFDSADITNQYLLEGVEGGLITMLLFIVVIVLCFRRVGITVQADEARGVANFNFLPWALGSALFVHVVTFNSVSYFDQMYVCWYMLLGMIAALPNLTIANALSGRDISSESSDRIN